MTTMSDVADPLACPFCGARDNLDHIERGYFDCHDCGASFRYSKRLGEITDKEPPDDLDLTSKLLHRLRDDGHSCLDAIPTPPRPALQLRACPHHLAQISHGSEPEDIEHRERCVRFPGSNNDDGWWMVHRGAVDQPETEVRRDAPRTSRAAALKALPKSGTHRAKVLDFISGRGPYGATDEEVQGALSMSPNSERPRRVELVRGGHVVDSGRTRLSDMGNDSIVWVATEEQT